jgi:hypothetical protein
MTPARSFRGSRRWCVPLIAGALLSAGCAAGAGSGDGEGEGAGPSPRPATKVTCPDVAWEPAPELQVVRSSRELVGFSSTLLGVHSTWTGAGFTAETVAGGYADDLLEAYDDLKITGSHTVAPGVEAEVMRGQFVEDPVLAVVWRDPGEGAPCDVRALLVTGAGADLEDELLRGLG